MFNKKLLTKLWLWAGIAIVGVLCFDGAPSIAKTKNAMLNKKPHYLEQAYADYLRRGPLVREEIILFTEDFEIDPGWTFEGTQWAWASPNGVSTGNDSNGAYNSPDNNNTGEFESRELVSNVITIPELGAEEIMNFKFDLLCGLPDYQQEDITDPNDPDFEEGVDESEFLADYYNVSILDTEALAWIDVGDEWWCHDPDTEGYLDSWIQYLDTPQLSIPANGSLTVDMKWAIESADGATGSISGSCTDGWDTANVRVSIDGGTTWNLLTDTNHPYDFNCGYGWIYNDAEYEAGGSLDHLAPGWGGTSPDGNNYTAFTFDLSAYAGNDVIIRFAFGSDPAFSTPDDSSLTGFKVRNLVVNGTPIENSEMTTSGEVWIDQFYDYCDVDQPGADGWAAYLPGYPFNGNAFMDISSFASKTVQFKFSAYSDGNLTTEVGAAGSGDGLWIDNLVVFKVSSGSYAAPSGLTGVSGSESAILNWTDMNGSGTENFIYDNDNFDNGINMVNEDSVGWAGTSFNFGGNSTVNSVDIYRSPPETNPDTGVVTAQVDFDMSICSFGTSGTLFNNTTTYDCIIVNTATFSDGWNTVDIPGSGWAMSGSYIIAHDFNSTYSAALDESASGENSYFTATQSNDSLGTWDGDLSGDGSFEGEWGIRANITYASANVTYSVYRNGAPIISNLTNNSYTDTFSGVNVNNITTYEYAITATYPDLEESEPSATVSVTPLPEGVTESAQDDGSAESFLNAGDNNFLVTKFTDSSADIIRVKWYQQEAQGGFYIKIFEDNNGAPGNVIYTTIAPNGNAGWNEKTIPSTSVTTPFYIGAEEFTSTKAFGIDTSSTGHSWISSDAGGSWDPVTQGTAMFRVFQYGTESPACTAGDANSDGTINVLDIVTIVQFVTNISTPSEAQTCASDVNNDDSINVLDIVSVVNIIVNGGFRYPDKEFIHSKNQVIKKSF